MTDYSNLKRLAYAAPMAMTMTNGGEEHKALIAFTDEVKRLFGNDVGMARALIAEIEALRRERKGKVLCDLELFETLRDSANSEADEHRQCMATYRPLRQASLDSVVKKCDDLLAAMSKEG